MSSVARRRDAGDPSSPALAVSDTPSSLPPPASRRTTGVRVHAHQAPSLRRHRHNTRLPPAFERGSPTHPPRAAITVAHADHRRPQSSPQRFRPPARLQYEHMFAVFVSAVAHRLRRAAALVRAFAFLEDDAPPVTARRDTAHTRRYAGPTGCCEDVFDPGLPRGIESLEAPRPTTSPDPRALGHQLPRMSAARSGAATQLADAVDAFRGELDRPSADRTQRPQASVPDTRQFEMLGGLRDGQVADESSGHRLHPHRRPLARLPTGRRPGSPMAHPLVCVTPIDVSAGQARLRRARRTPDRPIS
jgi:hypothetical protein